MSRSPAPLRWGSPAPSAAFFLVSMVLVERANTVGPALTLPVALTVYGIKVVILGVIVFGTDAVSHLNAAAFCWSVVGATLAWLVAHAVAVWRTKMPYLIFPETTPEAAPEVMPLVTSEVIPEAPPVRPSNDGSDERVR